MMNNKRNHKFIGLSFALAPPESQQNLLLIEYQQVKYFKECNC